MSPGDGTRSTRRTWTHSTCPTTAARTGRAYGASLHLVGGRYSGRGSGSVLRRVRSRDRPRDLVSLVRQAEAARGPRANGREPRSHLLAPGPVRLRLLSLRAVRTRR